MKHELNLFYAPPLSSEVAIVKNSFSFLGSDGRIGRLRYIAWLTIGYLAITGGYFLFSSLFARLFIKNHLIDYMQMSSLFIFWGVFYIVLIVAYSIRCTTQRLQDFNYSKWLSLLLIIPLLNVLLVAIFMIIPGNGGENKYGMPPPPNSKLIILSASIFFIVVGFLLVMFVF